MLVHPGRINRWRGPSARFGFRANDEAWNLTGGVYTTDDGYTAY